MVRRSGPTGRTIHYAVLGTVLLVMVAPLLWMMRVSLLPAGESLTGAVLLEAGITLANFIDLFATGNLERYLFNSLVVALVVTAGNIVFCVMVGYVLARRRTLGSRIAFGSVLMVLLLPVHIIIIPLYLLCLKTGLYDTYGALILPFLLNPIGVFLVKQYLEGIPASMEEAARIDGASEIRILFTIVMPLAKPVIAVLAVLAFITNWNSFLFPFILTSSDNLRTLPVALAMLQGHQAIDWQHLMAGSTVAVIPILILFAFSQRHVVSGITAGGIKQ